MSLETLTALAPAQSLEIFGTLEARPEDGIGNGTIALLGPREPGFWKHVTSEPEFLDGKDDPLDRWSLRVISALSDAVSGTPLFPFGSPKRPFFSWATRSGRAWSSPVILLVHEAAGLMVSYRGAVLLPEEFVQGPERARPCETCPDRPCLTACPVQALTSEGYDLERCHAFLDTEAGLENMTKGCAVRRACPLSQKHGRSEKQSAFHMRHFHR